MFYLSLVFCLIRIWRAMTARQMRVTVRNLTLSSVFSSFAELVAICDSSREHEWRQRAYVLRLQKLKFRWKGEIRWKLERNSLAEIQCINPLKSCTTFFDRSCPNLQGMLIKVKTKRQFLICVKFPKNKLQKCNSEATNMK
jgi:hypothetical protein